MELEAVAIEALASLGAPSLSIAPAQRRGTFPESMPFSIGFTRSSAGRSCWESWPNRLGFHPSNFRGASAVSWACRPTTTSSVSVCSRQPGAWKAATRSPRGTRVRLRESEPFHPELPALVRHPTLGLSRLNGAERFRKKVQARFRFGR